MQLSFRLLVLLGLLIEISLNPASAQDDDRYSQPIIDIHAHGPLWGSETIQPIEPWLEKFDELNVKKVVLAAYPDHLPAWTPEDPERLIPSLMFPCFPQVGRPCFQSDELLPDIAWIREEVSAGRIKMLGEIVTQVFGVAPNSEEMAPYFALAAEFDIPFGLHMGLGPLYAVTTDSIYKEYPDFQISYGNPLLLEEVLRAHPDLRLYIMHAGWPLLDETLTVLWHNPNVYVELGHLQLAIERAEYYTYLRRLVEAGFGDRVMYGSDIPLADYGEGIDAILDAPFLSEEQKRDILYNNAARFLRLSEEEIAAHHAN